MNWTMPMNWLRSTAAVAALALGLVAVALSGAAAALYQRFKACSADYPQFAFQCL